MTRIFWIAFLLLASLVYGQEGIEIDFSPAGGIYAGKQKVTLESDSGATIYYTLDGSLPSSGSFRYKKPIVAEKTTVIRAIAYVKGKRSGVHTSTYFTEREYTLPVISIATNPGNFFDSSSGMFVKGCCADTVEPYMGANFMKGWERPINIEMYEADGSLCFNQKAGVRVFGGYSRMLPQKSLAIIARSKYGKNRFEYKIFPNRPHKKYKSFVLRNSGGDFMRTHLRDAFMTQMAKPTGLAIQEYRPAIVYINGAYWGIQNMREKINEHYLEQNYGAEPDSVDLLKHRGSGTAQHGSTKAYKQLLAFLKRSDMESDETIEELSKFMDIQDYINYNIAEVYSDNRDAGGNIRYWKENKDSAKWRWILFDLDLGLNNNNKNGYKHNTLRKFTSVNNEVWPDPPWSTFIIRRLLRNKIVQIQYINTFADQLNTVYHADTAMNLLNKMARIIEPEIELHQKRWFNSLKNWNEHMESLRLFIRGRPYWLRKHVMQKFELTDTAYVSIEHPGNNQAEVYFNSMKINRDYKGLYFVDVPVHIWVEPEHDVVFKGWEGREETEVDIWVNVSGDLLLKPLFEPKKASTFRDSLIFNEICYFQTEDDTSKDWIELYNRSGQVIDVSNWHFTDSKYSKGWDVPANTLIEPGEFLILSQKKEYYASSYSLDSVNVVGGFNEGISANGEHIKLYDNDGYMVDSLTLPPIESDSAITLSRVHIDSLGSNSLGIESPSPGNHSKNYLEHLQYLEDEAYWTKVFFIGGGGFFFILVGGFFFFRYSRKKKRKATSED